MFTLVFLILANFAIGGHGSIQFQEPKLERFALASTHGVFEMLDPKTAKNRRYLIKHLFGGNESQYTEWLGLYDQAIEHGSKIPYDVAMIKFREKYVQSGKYWSRRIQEGLEEGGSGSGNFGHAGRPGEVGGSGEGGGGLVAYHSTAEHNLEDILKEGVSLGTFEGAEGRVYMTTEFSDAQKYAELLTTTPYCMILKVAIPRGVTLRYGHWDAKHWDLKHSYYTTEAIKPEWIKGYYLYERGGEGPGTHGGHLVGSYVSQHESHENIYWIPITIKSLSKSIKIKEGGTGSGNFGHAGRPGEVGGSGEGGTVYHGTDSESIKSILKSGISPHPNNRVGPASFYAGARKESIFVTDDFDHANAFADFAARKVPFKHLDPVICEIEIPTGTKLRPDTTDIAMGLLSKGTSSYYLKGTIPPSWIKAIYVTTKSLTDYDKKSVANYYKRVATHESLMNKILYVPLLIEREGLSETGSAKSGNYGHAGVVGKRGGSKAGTGGKAGRMKNVLDTGELDLNDVPKSLGGIFSNWQQEKAEKMVLIGKDGTYIVVGTGGKGSVDISMKGIQAILKDNGQDFSTLKYVVHNHNNGEAASQADVTAFKAFMAAGFSGDYQTYTPATGQIRNVPYSLGHEELQEGGPGSGNFGHAGRAGEVGGSGDAGGGVELSFEKEGEGKDFSYKVVHAGKSVAFIFQGHPQPDKVAWIWVGKVGSLLSEVPPSRQFSTLDGVKKDIAYYLNRRLAGKKETLRQKVDKIKKALNDSKK